MLLQFDSSIKNFDVNCVKQSRALETLLGAFQSNQHVIFIDLNDLRFLKEHVKEVVSASSRVALQSLMNRAVEYQSLLSVIEYKIIVYLADAYRQGVNRQGNTWFVPLEYFAGSGIIQSAILGENDLDAELFIHFAQIYQYRQRLNSFLLAGRPKSGGGSGTPRTLTNYLRHEYSPCLCVTDSDKLHPGYKQSSTSRNCRRAAQIKNRVVEYISLEEREIENLLPVDLLKKVVSIDDFSREFDNNVIEGDNFWKYIDLKEGVSLKWIEKRDPVTQQFWKKAKSSLSRRVKNCGFCKELEGEAEKEKCHCSTIKGLGDQVLERVVTYLNENQPKFTSKLLQDDNRWERLGKMVFDFSIAPRGEMLFAA